MSGYGGAEDRRAQMGPGFSDAGYGGYDNYPQGSRSGGYGMPAEQGRGAYAGPGSSNLGNPDSMDFAQNLQAAARSQGFDLKWKTAFFTCACCVVAAGAVSAWTLFVDLQPGMGFVQQIYVTAFGILMFVLDCPWPHTMASQIREIISKYLRFLTLFTGRGAMYLFLATMTMAALHDFEHVNGFLGYILGGYIGLIGTASLVVGVKRTLALKALKETLLQDRQLLNEALNGRREMRIPDFIELAKKCGYTFNEEEAEFFFESYVGGSMMDDGGSLGSGLYLRHEDIDRWLNPVKKEDQYVTVF